MQDCTDASSCIWDDGRCRRDVGEEPAYQKREVKPRTAVRGKILDDVNTDGVNTFFFKEKRVSPFILSEQKKRSSILRHAWKDPETMLNEDNNDVVSFLQMKANNVKGNPEAPTAVDLFDAHQIADRRGRAGILAKRGKMEIIDLCCGAVVRR